jgi:hypothetical protein
MKWSWLMALAMFAAACSSESTSPMGAVDMRRGAVTCMPSSDPVVLGARYAVQATLLVSVKFPADCSGAACVVDDEPNAELLLLGDVTQTGTSATVTVTPCDLTIPAVALKGKNMPLRLSIPSGSQLLTAFKPVTATGNLDGPNNCARFSTQPITIALGANLADPTSDPLPGFTLGGMPTAVKMCGGSASTACLTRTTPAPSDTGCVCDQDADGKLGATLTASNVPGLPDIDKVYVDLRTSISLDGQAFQPSGANKNASLRGKIGGLKLDQKILGCHRTSPAGDCADLDVSTAAAFSPVIRQSPDGDSTFIAVPIDAAATCQTIQDQRNTLFQ